MKKCSKKIKLLILATLSIGLFNVTCANENYVIKKDPAPLYDLSENADNMLFEFMRANQLLSFLESSAMKIGDEAMLKKIKALPFRGLYNQLEAKLRALVQTEEDFGVFVTTPEGWDTFVNWKKETEDMRPCVTKDGLETNLNQLYKSRFECKLCDKSHSSNAYVRYQNILDHLSLNLVFKYDLNQLMQGYVHESSFTNLQELIEGNHDVLREIEQIANNGFKIEVETFVSKQQSREIRSLAEIVIHVRKLQLEEKFQKSEL